MILVKQYLDDEGDDAHEVYHREKAKKMVELPTTTSVSMAYKQTDLPYFQLDTSVDNSLR